jgi:hypothetical protein
MYSIYSRYPVRYSYYHISYEHAFWFHSADFEGFRYYRPVSEAQITTGVPPDKFGQHIPVCVYVIYRVR